MDLSVPSSKPTTTTTDRQGPKPLKLISRESQFPSFKSPRSPPPRKQVETIKCVIIGDSDIGKTSLLTSFLFNEFSHDTYHPTVRDDYTFCTNATYKSKAKKNEENGKVIDIDLDIVDTGGQVM